MARWFLRMHCPRHKYAKVCNNKEYFTLDTSRQRETLDLWHCCYKEMIIKRENALRRKRINLLDLRWAWNQEQAPTITHVRMRTCTVHVCESERYSKMFADASIRPITEYALCPFNFSRANVFDVINEFYSKLGQCYYEASTGVRNVNRLINIKWDREFRPERRTLWNGLWKR